MYRIDDDKCVKCGLCIDECPSKAFVGAGRKNLRHSVVYDSVVLDPDLCTECGECVAYQYWCPFEAVYDDTQPRPEQAPADGTKYSNYIYTYDVTEDPYYRRFGTMLGRDGQPLPNIVDSVPWKWVTRLDGDTFEGSNFYTAHWCMPQDVPENVTDEKAGHPAHIHHGAELIISIGGDPENPDELGGEFEFYLGPEQEKHVINKTCVIYLPPFFPHGPWIPKRTTKPWLFVQIIQTPRLTEKVFNQLLPPEVVEFDDGLEYFRDEGF